MAVHSYNTFNKADFVEPKKPSFREPHTMDPRTWLRDLSPYFLFVLFIVTLGPLLFGFHLAELNTPSDVLTCKKKSLDEADSVLSTLPTCIPMTIAELGLVSSIFTLGGFLGALSAGPICASRGRIRAMQLTTIFFILGPAFEALAPSITIISIGRFISGLGAGASVVVVPIYVSEIAPPAERGFFGSFTQVMVNGGIFVTQLLGFLLSFGQMWRVVFAAGGLIGLGLTFGLLTVPESPTWLASVGRVQQARENLQRLRGNKFDIEEEFSSYGTGPDALIAEEARLLAPEDESSLEPPSKHKTHVSMIETLTIPEYRRAVIAVVMVMVAQQLTGINSIIMYGVALLSDLLSSSSALLNLFVSLLNIAVTIGCAPLADKLGRKTCLLASICGMGVSSVFLGIGIKESISSLSAIAVLTFVASFGFGLGPIPFILASELVGPEAVNATQSWALGANWISTFIVAQFFPTINTWLGPGITYFVFAAMAAFFATFVTFFVPETKGKKDADEVWGRVSARRD